MLVLELKRGTSSTECNSKYDPGLFYYAKDDKLQGLMVCFVDDILLGGTDAFKT